MLCLSFKSHDKVKEEKKKNQPKSKHPKLSSWTKNSNWEFRYVSSSSFSPMQGSSQTIVSSGVWAEAPTHRPFTWQRVKEIKCLVSRQDSRTFSHHGDIMGELVRALSLDSSQPGFQGQLYHVTLNSWFHFLFLVSLPIRWGQCYLSHSPVMRTEWKNKKTVVKHPAQRWFQ